MDLFVNQRVPDIYESIRYGPNEFTLYERPKKGQIYPRTHPVFSISLIPDYFNVKVYESPSLVTKSYDQNNIGYAIMLKNDFDIDTYLKERFGSNHKNLIKRHLRLESCFNISYKIFHGDIKKEDYLFLMNCLHAMLSRRFKQRGEINEKLQIWDELLATTYNQINKKSASLFVIYENESPIDISINYHFQKIMFGAISSYDIDYHKFGLGSVEKIKLLEWCVSNKYKVLEFGYGDLDYKRSWSNYSYRFRYQVIYDSGSYLSLLIARLELMKLGIKEYLKEKKIDLLYRKVVSFKDLGNQKAIIGESTGYAYEKSEVENLNSYGELRKVGDNIVSHLPLKLALNDFLFATKEHKDKTVVLEIVNDPKSYIISGAKIAQKFTFLKC